jgi:Flp pilus assembly pilin Flp
MKLSLGLYKQEAGQDLIEYALTAGLLVIGAVALIGQLPISLNSEFCKLVARFQFM